MTLLWTSSRIHNLLSKGSTISIIEFYIICGIICTLIVIIVIMIENKKETKEENRMLYDKITAEYKKYVSSETKIIQLKISEITKEVKSITPTLNDALGEIKDMTSDTNKRIDELYKSKFN